jgi:hypothetical protein
MTNISEARRPGRRIGGRNLPTAPGKNCRLVYASLTMIAR